MFSAAVSFIPNHSGCVSSRHSPPFTCEQSVLRAAGEKEAATHPERTNAQQLQQRLVPSTCLYLILKQSESVQLYEKEATQH